MTHIADHQPVLLERKSWIYLAYWSVLVLFLGIIIGTDRSQFTQPIVHVVPIEEDHSAHLTHDHSILHNQRIEVPAFNAPTVAIEVVKDAHAGWNLYLETENFTFAPEQVNDADRANHGHAHIYVDGMKVARLYGTSYHLADMAPGPHVVEVSLNGNSHAVFAVEGVDVAATAQIIQPE